VGNRIIKVTQMGAYRGKMNQHGGRKNWRKTQKEVKNSRNLLLNEEKVRPVVASRDRHEEITSTLVEGHERFSWRNKHGEGEGKSNRENKGLSTHTGRGK